MLGPDPAAVAPSAAAEPLGTPSSDTAGAGEQQAAYRRGLLVAALRLLRKTTSPGRPPITFLVALQWGARPSELA